MKDVFSAYGEPKDERRARQQQEAEGEAGACYSDAEVERPEREAAGERLEEEAADDSCNDGAAAGEEADGALAGGEVMADSAEDVGEGKGRTWKGEERERDENFRLVEQERHFVPKATEGFAGEGAVRAGCRDKEE